MKAYMRLVVATFAAAFAVPVAAQTQAQQDRVNLVARYVVTGPMCERLGMNLDADFPTKAANALQAETAAWGVDPTAVNQMEHAAIERQSSIMKTDLDAASEGAKSEAQVRGLRDILLRYGQVCMAMTSDPIFSSLMTLPPGYDLDKAVTAFSDTVLESGGLASWQTPRIQARGDLMMLAGTCRSKIGPARSDALVKEYGRSDNLRERAYYTQAFDEGLADPTVISTLAGCDRAIATSRAKASGSHSHKP